LVAFLCLLPAALDPPPARAAADATLDSIRYVVRVADQNAVGVTLTNYGVIGNNFVSRSPSLEYPLGTGYEHLVVGGLWFGAHAVDGVGPFTGVSCAAQDGPQGSPTTTLTEFTPAGLEITRHSRNPASPVFDPGAVSDMDYRWAFSDRPARVISGQEAHRPLNILVRASALSWVSSPLQDFLILRFTIINLGAAPLTGAWAGLWTELASGDKNSYTCWPPSSVCGTSGSWFSKKWLQYDAPQRLLREHYCAALPVPGGCELSRVPAWMGVQLLSHTTAGQHVTVAAWNYGPGNESRDEDTERYGLMSAGTIQDLTWPELMPQTGDPVEMLAFGPFGDIASGDSITADFALVGGGEVADIQAHADSAQAFYDNGFGAGPLVGVGAPHRTGFALAGARPNPGRGDLQVSFSLPDAASARIDLWDVAGRLLLTREVGPLGAGSHLVDLAPTGLPAGVYLIRLTRGGRALTARAVVVR